MQPPATRKFSSVTYPSRACLILAVWGGSLDGPCPTPPPCGILFPVAGPQVTPVPASCPLGLAPWKSRTNRRSLRSCPSGGRDSSWPPSRRSASCTASSTTLLGVVGGVERGLSDLVFVDVACGLRQRVSLWCGWLYPLPSHGWHFPVGHCFLSRGIVYIFMNDQRSHGGLGTSTPPPGRPPQYFCVRRA